MKKPTCVLLGWGVTLIILVEDIPLCLKSKSKTKGLKLLWRGVQRLSLNSGILDCKEAQFIASRLSTTGALLTCTIF